MVLYDGGVRYADLREKASAIVESRHNLASIRGSVKGQVRQAAVELDTCGLNRASALKQVDLAKETYRVAKANFDLGVSTSYEVTDANAALTSAQINLAREDLGCQLSRLKLLKALGTIGDQYR
jgi:outer membrane protein TolC